MKISMIFHFWLVHAAIEVIKDCILGPRHSHANSQGFLYLAFLDDQVHVRANDLSRPDVEVNEQAHVRANDLSRLDVDVNDNVAALSLRSGMTLGASNHGVDARYQFVLVERPGHKVVGAEAASSSDSTALHCAGGCASILVLVPNTN
jgi:hypothetical protein